MKKINTQIAISFLKSLILLNERRVFMTVEGKEHLVTSVFYTSSGETHIITVFTNSFRICGINVKAVYEFKGEWIFESECGTKNSIFVIYNKESFPDI